MIEQPSMKPRIVIPAYTAPHPDLMNAIVHSRVDTYIEHGCSDLPGIRSLMISATMREDVSRLILIDSDIIPTVEQLQFMATTDLVTPDQAVCGHYWLKSQGRYSVEPKRTKDPAPEGYTEVIRSGLGFMAIDRTSFAKISGGMLPVLQAGIPSWFPFCIPMLIPNDKQPSLEYLADDLSLCHRLTTTGTRILCKNDLLVGHACGEVSYGPPKHDVFPGSNKQQVESKS